MTERENEILFTRSLLYMAKESLEKLLKIMMKDPLNNESLFADISELNLQTSVVYERSVTAWQNIRANDRKNDKKKYKAKQKEYNEY